MKIVIEKSDEGLQITWKDGPPEEGRQIDLAIELLGLSMDALSARRDNEPVADRILLLRSWPEGDERLIACVPVATEAHPTVEAHDVQSLLEGALSAFQSTPSEPLLIEPIDG